MNFSLNEMVDMVYALGESERNPLLAARIYAQRFPDRRHPRARDFGKVKERFERTGTVQYDQRTRGRPATDGENEQLVLQSVVENPHTSSRTISQQLQISQSSVSRITLKNKFHPYHVQLVQGLTQNDFIERQNFCLWARNMEQQENGFCNNILFTDEATFKKNGKVNRHNFHYYNTQNPLFVRELDHQHRWSINVWGGVVRDRVVGPHFFDGPLNGQAYLNFLRNEFHLYLDDFQLDLYGRLWFQHDGAPPHSSRIVKQYLDEQFEGRWIGRGGPVPWPARSPDLTKPDFFLWGYVHNRVYAAEVTTRENMKERIREAFRSINHSTLEAVNNSFLKRVDECIAQEGRHFEQILS